MPSATDDIIKMKSGIQPLQILINTNYLAKPQLPLTSDLFEFPFLSEKPSGMEKMPFISTNVKYKSTRMNELTHPERVQIFFSKPAMIQFLSKLPLEDDKERNNVLSHNVKVMLENIFPMFFPVLKNVKQESKFDNTMSVFDALPKEIFSIKENSYLKVGGITCTVDSVRLLDTVNSIPAYIKLYELSKDFVAKRDSAIVLLETLLKEKFDNLAKILNPKEGKPYIEKLQTTILSEIQVLGKTSNEVNVLNNEITQMQKKLNYLNDIENVKKGLLSYRGTNIGSIDNFYNNIRDFGNNLNVKIETDVDKLKNKKSDEYINNLIEDAEVKKKDAETAATSAASTTSKARKPVPEIEKTPENYTKLIIGLKRLLEYNKLLKGKPQGLNLNLDTDISELRTEIKSKEKERDDLKKKTVIDTSFLKSSGIPIQNDVNEALTDASKVAKIKSLSPKLNDLTTEYEIVRKINDITLPNPLNTTNIEVLRNSIKSVYDSHKPFFTNGNTSLKDAFMKLRKISGFAFLLTTTYHYSDNLMLEREYNINYNIDVEFKRAEFGFHRPMIEALRKYYNPERQSTNPEIYEIMNAKDGSIRRVEIEKFIALFEGPTTITTAELVNSNKKLIYETNVKMNLIGGIITKENAGFINCTKENFSIASDGLKEYYKLENSSFIDLQKEIAEVEKKNNIKYAKTKFSSIKSGLQNTPSEESTLGPNVSAPVSAATSSASVETISDDDLNGFINSYSNPESTEPTSNSSNSSTFETDEDNKLLVDYINKNSVVKNYFVSAYKFINYQVTDINAKIPNGSDTYIVDYKNKYSAAESALKLNKSQIANADKENLPQEQIDKQNTKKATINKLLTIIENINRQVELKINPTTGGKKRKTRKHTSMKLRKTRRRRRKQRHN